MKLNQKQIKLVKNGFKQPHVYNFIPWGSKNFLFFPFPKRILNAPIIQPGQLSHLFLFSNWTNPSLTFLLITSCKKVYYMKTMIEKSSVRGKFQQFSSIIFGRVNMTGYDIKATQSWFLFAVPPI